MNERFIRIRGQPLRYLIGGQGKALVLCHGFLSSAEEFGGRFSELGAQRTLIIPDLPGNGAFPPLRGRHTSGAMADLLFDLLAELGGRPLRRGWAVPRGSRCVRSGSASRGSGG
jgi:pimeloyl-ACP methyl ester carboxylesterase